MANKLVIGPKAKAAGVTTAMVAVAAAIAAPLITAGEERRYTAYDDFQPWVKVVKTTKIKGTLTVCDGHTGPDIVVEKVYTDAECDALRNDDMIVAQNAILRCTPKLYYSKYAAGATIDFAFNVGGANYCGSTMARKFEANDIAGGCKEYVKWVYSKGKFMRGLLNNRRIPEQKTCEKALS